MTFMKRIREDGFITKEELRQFLIVLNPLAPHITSEIYEIVFGKNIIDETYPDYDDSKMIESQIELPVQINGKLKGTILVNKDAEQSEVVEQIKTLNKYNIDPNLAKKIIFVPNKIINFIV
jgi:leucyl-tRNA synthetase